MGSYKFYPPLVCFLWWIDSVSNFESKNLKYFRESFMTCTILIRVLLAFHSAGQCTVPTKYSFLVIWWWFLRGGGTKHYKRKYLAKGNVFFHKMLESLYVNQLSNYVASIFWLARHQHVLLLTFFRYQSLLDILMVLKGMLHWTQVGLFQITWIIKEFRNFYWLD